MSNVTRSLHGLEPDKYDSTRLNINPGHCTDFYGTVEMDFPLEKHLYFNQYGLWGWDDQANPPVDGDNVCLYVLRDPSTGDYGVIATRSIFQGGVVCPSGYQVERKLPVSWMWRAAWGGVPDFHLSHWPSPHVRFTQSEYSSLWTAAAGLTTGGAWATVDVSPWVPDNARMAYLCFETRYVTGGTAGSAYAASSGVQSTGLLIGTASPAQTGQFFPVSLRVDSLRRFQVKTTGTGCALYVYVLGYDTTEPA